MTDKLKGFVVTLEEDIREDDADLIRNALGFIKGVVAVEPIAADGLSDQVSRARAMAEASRDLLHLFKKWNGT